MSDGLALCFPTHRVKIRSMDGHNKFHPLQAGKAARNRKDAGFEIAPFPHQSIGILIM
jgi:hypothetical protein